MENDDSGLSGKSSFAIGLLLFVGLMIAIFGIGIEFLLPGTSLGLNLPKLLIVAAGLVISFGAYQLRRTSVRRRLSGAMGKSIAAALAITMITLVVLEVAFTYAAISTYFPTHLPDFSVEVSPWWACDQSGCHYVYEAVAVACNNNALSGRPCMVNRQGFPDSEDFVAGGELDGYTRVLMLGDSFTFGMSADIGRSFVETLEAELPAGIVWNTGIPGTGTKQALASFKAFSSHLQPHITILGFFVNDFDDNLMPIDSWLNAVDSNSNVVTVRKYTIDEWENVTELDLRAIQLLTVYGKRPPFNELERQFGSTRLGTLMLRLIDALRDFEETEERFDTRIDITRRYLKDLRDEISMDDSFLLVLLIPGPEDIKSLGKRYQLAIGLMEELEIPYLSLIGLLDPASDYGPAPDIHWNNSGHQKVGALLSDCMEAFIASGNLGDCQYVVLPEPRRQ